MNEDEYGQEGIQKILEFGRLSRAKLYLRLVEKVDRGQTPRPAEIAIMRSLEEEIRRRPSARVSPRRHRSGFFRP